MTQVGKSYCKLISSHVQSLLGSISTLRLMYQENHIMCGTMPLMQTTPPQQCGYIILVVATQVPQSLVVPQIYHNFIMGPQIQLLNHCTTLPSAKIKIIFLYYYTMYRTNM